MAVGPGTAGYVPLARIPPWITEAALQTEDRAFFVHQGFRASLIRGALRLNLKHRRYVYGGSTITQQLVKNLFLTRRKDLARKLEEAVIVAQVERTLSKRRILELYLNCIEYGPGIWGLVEASRVYFAARPEALTPAQGIYLMALKPYPRYGFATARRGHWPPNWRRRMRNIFGRVHRRGVLTDAQLQAAAPEFRPRFAGLHPDERPPPAHPTAQPGPGPVPAPAM